MAKPIPRTKTQASQHRPLVAALYLKGYTQLEIGEQLGISQMTVSRDLKLLQEMWRQSAVNDIETAKHRELEKIDVLESEAWNAWLRSQADAETETITDVGMGDKPITKRERKGQTGNAQYLATVQWCIAQRCKILGIEAPAKQELAGTLEIKVIREESSP